MDLKDGIPTDPMKFRYLGVSYHFNDQGDIATCSHVVKSLKEGESLVAVEMYDKCLAYRVEDTRCHSKYDFAVGHVRRDNYKALPLHGKKEIFIGADVMAFGFTTDGKVDNRNVCTPRLFKGHIVRTHYTPLRNDARSTCEISFPSHNGFSGTPLLFNKPETSLAGMLFGNLESTITLHKISDVDESGSKYSEEIHKVVELGVAHTAFDIRCFLDDLGITRIPLDTPEPDLI
jgi:Trypsin-like peptidase domain